MSKFKVGDKVKVIGGYYPTLPREAMRVVAVGSAWRNEYIIVQYGVFTSGNLNPDCFELVEETPFPLYSEEQAVKLLTERGYEVKAPPEPLKGKVIVWANPFGAVNVSQYRGDSHPEELAKFGHKVLAIVDWTEGQGI